MSKPPSKPSRPSTSPRPGLRCNYGETGDEGSEVSSASEPSPNLPLIMELWPSTGLVEMGTRVGSRQAIIEGESRQPLNWMCELELQQARVVGTTLDVGYKQVKGLTSQEVREVVREFVRVGFLYSARVQVKEWRVQ